MTEREPTVVGHTYPLGVLGADQTGSERTCRATLLGVAEWLPHPVAVGADTLMLGPVFALQSHGYDTVTHRDIDDRLGALTDFDALVAAAAARDIGIVLDGVFAYASRTFGRLTDPEETVDPWFLRDATGQLIPWRVDSLVTPDFGSIGYQSYVADVMCSWLDRGICGWRLDSAWSVPAGFWRTVLAAVRRSHPRAWFLGQVLDDDLPSVINQATYSSATEYAVVHGAREWLAGGPVERVVSALRVHQHNCARTPVYTFLGNHHFARLADVISADLIPAAFCMLLTLPGIPAVYYGNELAVTSSCTQGGPDSVLRPAMTPDTPHRVAGPSRDVLTAVTALGAFRHTNPWLTYAALDRVEAHENGALTYQVTDAQHSIRVYLNPTPAPVTFPPGPCIDGPR